MKKYKITLKEAGMIAERVVFATSAYEAENIVINKMVAEYK